MRKLQFLNLSEGNCIYVYSGGRLAGQGSYVSVVEDKNESFLCWRKHNGNEVYTNLNGISVETINENTTYLENKRETCERGYVEDQNISNMYAQGYNDTYPQEYNNYNQNADNTYDQSYNNYDQNMQNTYQTSYDDGYKPNTSDSYDQSYNDNYNQNNNAMYDQGYNYNSDNYEYNSNSGCTCNQDNNNNYK